MLEVFHFSYLSFAWSGYNVDRCPKSVYSKIVNDANYSCIWAVKLEIKKILVHAYPQFSMKNCFHMPLSCMYTKWGKKSLWIGGYTEKKVTGDI